MSDSGREKMWTKGPWRISDYRHINADVGQRYIDAHDGIVCETYRGRAIDETVANATLIAVSPELYALAEKVAVHFADTDAPLGIEARAALAKAEGRQP